MKGKIFIEFESLSQSFLKKQNLNHSKFSIFPHVLFFLMRIVEVESTSSCQLRRSLNALLLNYFLIDFPHFSFKNFWKKKINKKFRKFSFKNFYFEKSVVSELSESINFYHFHQFFLRFSKELKN